VTGSSRFFIDILKRDADVVELDCDGWRGGRKVGAADVDAVKADVVVFWQTVPYLAEAIKLRTPASWVPMYDSAVHRSGWYWSTLSHTGIKVVSFCRALSAVARRHGIPVSDYTYYPEPVEPPRARDRVAGLRVFLWDRGDIGIDELRGILGAQRVEQTVLRAAPDPGLRASVLNASDTRRYNARVITGALRREQHLELLSSSNVFVAPRRFEGIGMSFLEAMAMGLAVVAPDRPTMNEYIEHGLNGYLYDPARPHEIDLRLAAAVGEQARLSILAGRRDWLAQTEGLLADILSARPMQSVPPPADPVGLGL